MHMWFLLLGWHSRPFSHNALTASQAVRTALEIRQNPTPIHPASLHPLPSKSMKNNPTPSENYEPSGKAPDKTTTAG
ncbi:hypothetical protein VTO42DRAFT_2516 [Malbranchea cinnamomea]